LPVAGLLLVVALGYAVWQILPPGRGTRGTRGDIADASNGDKEKVKPADNDRKAKPADRGDSRKTKPADTDKDKDREKDKDKGKGKRPEDKDTEKPGAGQADDRGGLKRPPAPSKEVVPVALFDGPATRAPALLVQP